MRTVCTDKLRVKVQVEQCLHDALDWDELSLDVSEVGENKIILKEPVNPEVVETVSAIKISFRIAGKWKHYEGKNIKAVHDPKTYVKVDCIEFVLNEDELSDFRRDLRIARA